MAKLSDNRVAKAVTALTPMQKVGLGAAVLTIVAGGFVLARGGKQASMAALFTDLEARDAADVTDALIEQGVEYELVDGGRTVLVPSDRVYDLRVDLSADGLPGASEGYALLDKQGITTSEFRQRIDFQRALEGELASTLRAIDGVESATVHLALPEESVFVDEPATPTASVLVATESAHPLTADQVSAMVHLVAASVRDMDPADVTIADASGIVLASGGEQRGAAGAGATQGEAAEFEQELAASLRAMVARVAGPDSVSVTVQADLDLTERETTTERYDSSNPETGVVVAETTSTETYTGAEAAAETGVLGPDGATVEATAPGAESSYDKDDTQRSYAVNRTVEQVTDAPGDVTRLNVAVLVDEANVSEAERAEIEAMIATAAGIDAARGDQLSVTRLAFDTTVDEAAVAAAEAEAAAAAKAERSSLIRLGVIGLLVLVAMVLAYRSTRRARREVSTPIDIGAIRSAPLDRPLGALGDAGSTSELGALAELGGPLDQLAAGTVDGPTEPVNPLEAASRDALGELSELAERRPEEVAHILQTWLSDESARSR